MSDTINNSVTPRTPQTQPSVTPSATPAPAYAAPTTQTPERRWFVLVVLTVVCLAFLGMIGVLYYQWLTVREPRTVVIFEGTATYLDDRAVISNGAQTFEKRVQLDQDGKYTCRFLLSPGRWLLEIHHAGQVRKSEPMDLKEYQATLVRIREEPTTAPSAAASARSPR